MGGDRRWAWPPPRPQGADSGGRPERGRPRAVGVALAARPGRQRPRRPGPRDGRDEPGRRAGRERRPGLERRAGQGRCAGQGRRPSRRSRAGPGYQVGPGSGPSQGRSSRYRMTGPRVPERVLVLSAPDGPDAEPESGGAARAAGGSGPGAGSGPAARVFEPWVAVVEEFCPKVEVLRPGTCAISVRGPARYFGGESELVRKIAAAVRAAGFAGQIGVADGLFAAELAATLGPDGQSGPDARIVPSGRTVAFLAAQPVSALGRPELSYLLPRLGITTLGEFAALPAAEAANRFGASGELTHRLARGLDPRPLAPRPPAADLSVRYEFDPPSEQSEPVVFAAKSLAEDLHARLAASGLACVRIQVQVHCEDGREISRFWRHDGLLSGLAVAERVRWQLDAWRTGQEADPEQGSGITLLRLIPDQLVRATGRQLGLWGDAVVTDRVARSAIRVQAMLGHGSVVRPLLAGGPGPGAAVS